MALLQSQNLCCSVGSFIPSTRNSLVSPDKISVGNFSATGCGNKKGMLSKRHGIYSEAPKGTEIKATEPQESKSAPARTSILCKDCEGNGAVVCSQCGGAGINDKDHFNGHFKAGAICWLCRGKKEMLCGVCNGAGFIGGFMNAFED